MTHTAALLIGGSLVLLGAFLGQRARAAAVRARLLATTPLTPLGSLRAGLVKVHGVVRLGRDVLVAPLSQRRCAHYRVEVQERGRAKRWTGAFTAAETAAFFLEDVTGACKVHLANAEVHLSSSHHWGEDPPLPPALADSFRQRFGHSFGGSAPARFWEAALEEGARLMVVGEAVHAPEGGGYLLRKGQSLCLASDQDERLLVQRAKYKRDIALLQAGAAVVMGLFVLSLGWR